MSNFSTQWLALREPLDAEARDAGLVASLVDSLAAMSTRKFPLEVIDLGAGTGANLRYAAPRLGGIQNWVLVDRDPLLLAAVEHCMGTWADDSDALISGSGASLALRDERFDCRLQCVPMDLATQVDRLPLPAAGLLTASALLDLVSEQWLRTLIHNAADAQLVVWFALSYDGRMSCHPMEPEDEEVRQLVNRHQLRDKGFGIALGPAAARTATRILTEHGYRVQSAPSEWRAGPQRLELQLALVEGWFQAACDMAPNRISGLRDWKRRRCAHIEQGRSLLLVGHMDLVGTLKDEVNP